MGIEQRRGRAPLRLGVLGVLLIGCLLLAAVAVALALRGGEAATPGRGNRIVYGLTLNPSGFDPHIHQSSELGIPFFSVYDTLVYRHRRLLSLSPVCERWEMSKTGWRGPFLKQNVRFPRRDRV